MLALALDALTLPYRLKDGAPMWQMADTLAVSGRKVTSCCWRSRTVRSVQRERRLISQCGLIGGGRLRRRALSHDARRRSPRRTQRLRGRVALEASLGLP